MLSQIERNAVYAASIVGGVLVLLFSSCLCWKLRGRRKAAIRRRVQRELEETTTPRKPIPGFVVQHEMEVVFPTSRAQQGNALRLQQGRDCMVYRHGDVLLPWCMAERFRRKDEYIRATLGDAHAMHMISDDRLRLLEESNQLTVPPAIYSRRPGSAATMGHVQSAQSDGNANPSRRSYGGTISSRLSGNKLKLAVDWMKIQGERITGNEGTSSKSALPKPGVLKNQASKPNLAPRTLMKQASEGHFSYVAFDRAKRPMST